MRLQDDNLPFPYRIAILVGIGLLLLASWVGMISFLVDSDPTGGQATSRVFSTLGITALVGGLGLAATLARGVPLWGRLGLLFVAVGAGTI